MKTELTFVNIWFDVIAFCTSVGTSDDYKDKEERVTHRDNIFKFIHRHCLLLYNSSGEKIRWLTFHLTVVFYWRHYVDF